MTRKSDAARLIEIMQRATPEQRENFLALIQAFCDQQKPSAPRRSHHKKVIPAGPPAEEYPELVGK